MKHILICTRCQAFTMKDVHDCGQKTLSPKPPKYSPEDKYSKYRREVKQKEWEEKGLL